jgi:hypothetical protein
LNLLSCRGCEAKNAEILRLEARLKWFEDQIDRQNKRLLEIADPRINERLVQADRLDRKPVTAAPRAAPAAPLLPGTEPAPESPWEVDAES